MVDSFCIKFNFQTAQKLISYQLYNLRSVTISTAEIVEPSVNEILDIPYLQKFYGGDYDHAGDMFEIFLSHTVKEVPGLRILIEKEDWEATRRLAHRIKPNFSMVGLTQLEKKILAIEKMADKNEDANTLINFMNEVESKLAEAKPFLQAQLEKYKSLNK